MGREKSQKNILWILLAAELVLMLAVGSDILRERIRLDYDYTSLVLNSGRADANLGLTYIDSGYEFQGYFAYTAPVPVKKGRYLITIKYRSEADNNGFAILNAGADSFDKVLVDDFTLNPDKREMSFYIWVKEDLQRFMMASVYNGEGEFEIVRMSARETRTGAVLETLFILMLSLVLDAAYIIRMRAGRENHMEELKESCQTGFLLLATILFASMPLLNDFLIMGSDMEFHMLRIEGIREGLLSGQFPVRMQPIQLNGYGYPASLFYGDAFLYFPAILRILGMTVQGCYKFLLIAMNGATCLVMYHVAKKMLGNRRLALLAAVIYTLIPYRLNALYVRAAVGEMLAYVFLPLIVYGIYCILAEDVSSEGYRYNFWYAVAGFSGIINSHVLTCELVGFFTILACLICVKKVFERKRFMELLKTFFVSLFLNAGFLWPFFDMMTDGGIQVLDKYTFTGRFIQGQGLNIASLFDIFPSGNGIIYNHALREYGNYGMMREQGMTIGILLILFMGLVLIDGFFAKKPLNSGLQGFAAVGSVLGVFGLFMSLNIFPWDWLEKYGGHMVSNLQFPWRVLAVSSVLGVLAVMAHLKENERLAGEAGMLLLVFSIISAGYCMHDRLDKNSACHIYDVAGLDTSMTGSGSWNEYVPTGTRVELLSQDAVKASDEVSVINYSKQYTNIGMTVSSKGSGYVEVPLLFYKGYAAEDEAGNRLELTRGINNVLRIEIPENYQGDISIRYKGLVGWKIADVVSVITLILIMFLVIPLRKSGRN